MSEDTEFEGPAQDPHQVVGRAIQKLAAARLGRGFVPLALLFLLGLGRLLAAEGGGVWLAMGAPLSAAAMFAYGLRVTQRAFGRPHRRWMTSAAVGGLVPIAFGLYVFGWLGLRTLARWEGSVAVMSGIACTLLGLWSLRSWMKLSELQRLAEVMAFGLPSESGGDA